MRSWLRMTALAVLAAAAAVEAANYPSQRQSGEGATPLTYDNVVAFFKSAHLRPTEVQKRCTVFFEGEWKSSNIYSYCLILVENSDEDMQVTFYLTDAHEMNWITEFLDAAFFSRSETEKLFGLINSGRQNREERIGRFLVDFHRWQPRHAQILVFSFTRRPIGNN